MSANNNFGGSVGGSNGGFGSTPAISLPNDNNDGGFSEAANNLAAGISNQMVGAINEIASSAASPSDGSTTSQGTISDGSVTGYAINNENQWGWITLYVVTIVIAVLGNFLFIVACLCTKRTRTTGYYLLMNLSIRDILLAGLCIPFTLDSEIIAMTWNFGDKYCIVYRYFYYCFLFFLPLTLLFLAFHLFVENCKWNFAREEETVPRPWPHTIYLPLIWFFSAAFAVPTVFWTAVRPETDDPYRNQMVGMKPNDAEICMHRGGVGEAGWEAGSDYFYIASTLVTFCIPVILLFIPWWALLVQVCGCCTRRLRSSDFWLSIMTLFMILFYEASRAPFELFNFHHVLTNWDKVMVNDGQAFLPLAESYKAVMKWAVYAPALLHPLLYFTFSPEARHGVYILFSRMCSCCCSKSSPDVEVASDDEKGQMLNTANSDDQMGGSGHPDDHAVPLQSKQEEEM